jgi:hypothetical protein
MTSPLGALPTPPLVSPVDEEDFTAPWGAWFSVVQQIVYDSSNSGTTSQRPTTFRYTGKFFFDTTLGIPIWWNGTAWVNATGASV